MSSTPPPRTVPAWFAAAGRRHPDRTALQDAETEVKLSTLLDESARLAEALRRAGVEPGDRVGFYADNDRRWIRADLALQLVGAVSVPRGTDTPAEEMAGFLAHAEARFLIAHAARHAGRMAEHAHQMPTVERTFTLLPDGADALDALLGTVDAWPPFDDQAQAIEPERLATVIYTSGTTGRPKGVMLTQANFGHQVACCPRALEIRPDERFLSILPPWHIFERTVEYVALTCGCRLIYTDRRRLKDDMARHAPTFLPSVPRIWETVYDGIRKAVSSAPPVRRSIFAAAVRVGMARASLRAGARGERLRIHRPRGPALAASGARRAVDALGAAALAPLAALFDRIVFRKLRAATGGQLRGPISGGGLMPPHIDRFFRAIGLPVYVGYGLTETSPVLTLRRPGRNVLGSIGRTVDEVELEIRHPETRAALPAGEVGVVWTRGPQVMRGYYRDEAMTAAAIDADGWFDTGDLGLLTEDGDLCFRGRIKETIVLKGGENVEPSAIETCLLESPLIEQAVVVGQDRKTLAALLVPSADACQAAGLGGGTPAELAANPAVLAKLQREAADRTSHLRPFERVTRVRLVPEAFTPENGLLTPTLKMRRHVIAERLSNLIDEAYA
ncbi:MAG: long-chain fatty acid--CoA ligase [Planctomycetota bacterium]